MQPQIVKRVIVFVEWSIFLALLIGVGLFVQNVWFDFLSKATAIKEYTEAHHELEVKCLMFKKGQNVEVQVFSPNIKNLHFFVRFCSNFQGLNCPWVDQSLKV